MVDSTNPIIAYVGVDFCQGAMSRGIGAPRRAFNLSHRIKIDEPGNLRTEIDLLDNKSIQLNLLIIFYNLKVKHTNTKIYIN